MDALSELDQLEQERSESLLALNGEMTPAKLPRTIPSEEIHLRTLRLNEPVELWYRNPHFSRVTACKVAMPRYVISAASVSRLRTSPWHMIEGMVPASVDWKLWIVGTEFAFLYDRTSKPSRSGEMAPVRRAPCWNSAMGPEVLLNLCRTYKHAGWDRTFIVGMPTNPGPERERLYDFVHRTAVAFPEVRLHLHGADKWRFMFGLNFAAADMDPAKHSRVVVLPNGTTSTDSQLSKHLKWVHVLGFSVTDIQTVEGRHMFNLHSAMWAAENYSSEEALAKTRHHNPSRTDPLGLFAVRRGRDNTDLHTMRPLASRMRAPRHDPDKLPQMTPVHPDGTIDDYHRVEPVTNLPLVPVAPREKTSYDKILCDPCSLKDTCRYVRDGGLCILPKSPASDLARLFATRDVEQVRLALTAVLQHQADRLVRVSDAWDVDNPADLDTEEVIKRSDHQMKLENSLARGAEAMIKILDPAQRITSTAPAIDARQIHVYNPSTLVADVVKRLEKAGVARGDIEPSMIIEVARDQGMLEGPE